MSTNQGRPVAKKKVAAMQDAGLRRPRPRLAEFLARRAGKGHHNIAYHLGTLVLEEIGRHELIAVQCLAARQPLPPAWPERHSQDHIKKLFLVFFGGSFVHEEVSGKRLEEFSALAETIHASAFSSGSTSIP
jgi:hypothetical protein